MFVLCFGVDRVSMALFHAIVDLKFKILLFFWSSWNRPSHPYMYCMRSWLCKSKITKQIRSKSITIDLMKYISQEEAEAEAEKKPNIWIVKHSMKIHSSEISSLFLFYFIFLAKICECSSRAHSLCIHTQLEWIYSFFCCVQYCDCVPKSTRNEMKEILRMMASIWGPRVHSNI